MCWSVQTTLRLSRTSRHRGLHRGLRSHRFSQLVRHLLLWNHMQLKSLCAVHIPGELNHAADALSRQLTFPGEWRLHPETIRLIWSRFGETQVDLFASRESSHCQLYFSLPEGPLGTDPQAVVETITQARAPSTRQAYALKWSLFANWCSSRGENPRRCTMRVVLSSCKIGWSVGCHPPP